LNLFEGEGAIFVDIHRLKDLFVSSLKFLAMMGQEGMMGL
jgi:hypothetical protein